MRRSDFLMRAGLGALGGGLLHAILDAAPAWLPPDQRRRGLLRPPGARPEAEFLSLCIRCQRCAEACDEDAIRLHPSGWGRHAGTPFIVPELRACDLCGLCGEACPTGALARLPEPKDPAFAGAARMGTAVVDERLCVSHNGSGVCGACYTACPLKGTAISQGKHNAPTVKPAGCVGCGLCEEACIVRDSKAGRAIKVRSERGWA